MKARHSSDAVPLAFKKFVAFGFLVALSGCAGNKLEPDQIALMPAPAIYGDGRMDPFIDGDPVSRGVDPGILFATNRQPAEPDDRRYRHYTFERARHLHLGEAHVRVSHSESMTWDEARRLSLAEDRGDDVVLEIDRVEEFGVLAETIRPADFQTRRDPDVHQRFMDAIDDRLVVSRSKDVYIYVHGYKVDFENPILVASELWHFLGYNGAFIAYSWPTKSSVWAYFADLDNAEQSARYLRTLILEIAEHTDVERVHVIGYSAGTRLVGRMLADVGMYGYLMDDDEIDRLTRLHNVIMIGSDVDRDILTGYLLDGAVRIPDALTFYVSQGDNALEFSRRMFRGRQRAGELLNDNPVNDDENAFIRDQTRLRIVDVTDAEGGTLSGGHSYFRTSPWVSSDLLMTLLYDLAPEERGLVRPEGSPFWTFPPAYPDRLREAVETHRLSDAEPR